MLGGWTYRSTAWQGGLAWSYQHINDNWSLESGGDKLGKACQVWGKHLGLNSEKHQLIRDTQKRRLETMSRAIEEIRRPCHQSQEKRRERSVVLIFFRDQTRNVKAALGSVTWRYPWEVQWRSRNQCAVHHTVSNGYHLRTSGWWKMKTICTNMDETQNQYADQKKLTQEYIL